MMIVTKGVKVMARPRSIHIVSMWAWDWLRRDEMMVIDGYSDQEKRDQWWDAWKEKREKSKKWVSLITWMQ